MARIDFKDVTKRFPDGTLAVSEMSLDVDDGEFMILVGPSGCGKTTALRMVAGLEKATGGDILIDDVVVNKKRPKDRNVAFVFQNYALYPHMTVRQNMGFALRLARTPRREVTARVDEAAEILDLTEVLHRKPAQLSGGQRQRVAMGRAIVRKPSAFLMDEPLSNLDAKLRVQMRAELARMQSGLGTTTLYVTHDQTEAMTLGHRVAVMRHGVIQQVGPPRELYETPANLFVAGFIGSPAMNFVSASVADGTLRLPFGAARAPGEVPNGDVIVGFRPEHIEDAALAQGDPAGDIEFSATLEVVEWLGSELYAHFTLPGGHVDSPELRELETDSGVTHDWNRIVARLDARSGARAGEHVRLRLDASRLYLFDPETRSALHPLELERAS